LSDPEGHFPLTPPLEVGVIKMLHSGHLALPEKGNRAVLLDFLVSPDLELKRISVPR